LQTSDTALDRVRALPAWGGTRFRVGVLLAVSGVLGFRVGMVGFPTWHVAVETAQVLAGLVTYPPGNPVYIYHTKLWTILHHVCAVLLRAGMSEISISLVLSGVLGMVSLQALALFVYALSRDVLLALGAAFLIFFTRAPEHGVVYPIVLMGMSHTYGALGLSFIVLVAALFGAGAYRIGGLLLGLAPAVHPSLGGWLWLVLLIAVLWDFRPLVVALRPVVPWFIAGVTVTTVSLAVQLLGFYDVPAVDPVQASTYLTAFTQLWDAHRQPADLGSDGAGLNRDALLLAMAWLAAFRRQMTVPARLLLRIVVVSAVAGSAFLLLSWVPSELVPSWLLLLMPARLSNFNAMVFPALLFGLVTSLRNRVIPALVSVVLAAGLLLSRPSMLWERAAEAGSLSWLPRPHQTRLMEWVALALVIVAVVEWRRSRRSAPAAASTKPVGRVLSDPSRTAPIAARLAVLAICAVAALFTWQIRHAPQLFDRTNQAVFKVASEDRSGLIATGSAYSLIQLRTRRPVLLDSGALDTLSYAPESGPEMARILRDVYDLDLLHPPAGFRRGSAAIPPDHNKRVWEGFTLERWREIRRTWGVTQVLTSADHELRLPVAAQIESYRLYRIPE
jgi:hypothetical protein